MSIHSELAARTAEAGAIDARAYIANYGWSAAANRLNHLREGTYKDGWREALQALAGNA